MIELYTHPMSPCAQKVRIVLAEKRLEWEGRHVDLPGKENLEPWYLELNRLGVVPTLVEDGRAVIESSIICEYLEDRYPEPRLRPDDPHDIASITAGVREALERSEDLGPAGRRRAEQLTWTATAERTHGVYREVLS